MPTFSVSKGAAKAAKSDVLAVPVFEGLKLGPGAKEAQDALGSTVKELSEHVPVLGKPSKQFKGELGDAILVQTLGKLPAKQVLFVGMGPEKEADVGTIRRAGAMAARRVGGGKSVATTIPQAAGAPALAVRAFVGTWKSKDDWKADLSSEQAKIATEDAKSFAPPFDVVVFEQLS